MAVKIILYKMNTKEKKLQDHSFDKAAQCNWQSMERKFHYSSLRITYKFYEFPKTTGVQEEGESLCSSPKIQIGSKSRMPQSRV